VEGILTVSEVKGRVSIALWCAGFLVAGSAAAFVNSVVLSDDSSQELRGMSGASTVTTVLSFSEFVVSTGVEPGRYVLGGAGVVQLSTEGDTLALTSVVPAVGWRVAGVESKSARQLAIVLESSEYRLRFTATLVDGRIITSLDEVSESDDPTETSSTGTTTPSSGTRSGTTLPGGAVTTSLPRSTTTDDKTDDSTDDSTDDTEVDDDGSPDTSNDD